MRPPLEASAPPTLGEPGSWRFGRYRAPIASPSLGAASSRFRTKEWHYHSVVSDGWFLGVALVQLGYVANAFLYLVDRSEPARRRELEALSTLGRALRFAESSVRGTTVWRSARDRIAMHHDGGFRLELDLVLQGERLRGAIEIDSPRESLALVYPLAPDRPAYTHKAAGLPARGQLELGGRTLDFGDALATLDWTRSLARRHTHWKWASFAARAKDGRTLGLNLSAEVYDDHENAAFVDGAVASLGAVRFELPEDPLHAPWRISGGGELELEFQPLGARKQKLDLGLVRSHFIQPYGTFRGRITPEGHAPLEVERAFGVVEDHDALW